MYVPDYMNVKIIEQDPERIARLNNIFDNRVLTIGGDGRDTEILLNEGLETKDLVSLSEGITPKGLTSIQFLKEIRKRLEARLGA